jgi:hypothetical protein
MWAENDAAARELGLVEATDLDEAQWTALENFFSPTLRKWWRRI